MEWLQKNGKGKLFSSDFPYFRIKDPEKYIGIVVEKKLKNNWHLFVKGDENNLPMIFKKVKQIDIFSYDSDKTYSGKSKTFKKVFNYLTENSVIILDDIQDDSFFYDFVQKNNILYNIYIYIYINNIWILIYGDHQHGNLYIF